MQNVDRLALGKHYYELHKSGGGRLDWQQIATQSGTTYNKARETARAYKRSLPAAELVQNLRILPKAPMEAPNVIAAPDLPTVPDLIKEFLGDPTIYEPIAALKPKDIRKIIAIGDIHANPDTKLLREIIALKPDHIFIGGDLLNSEQVSTHPLALDEKRVKLQTEMRIDRAYIAALHTHTNAHIDIFYGNHDHRFHRLVSELLGEGLMFLVRDPLEMIIQGIPNVRIIKQPMYAKTPDGTIFPMGDMRYMAIVGDALLSHANFTGKNPGMAVRKLYGWVQEWRKLMQWPDFSTYVQFHGHKIHYSAEQGGYVQLVEPGMGGTQVHESYKLNYDAKWTAGTTGCVYFEQGNYGGVWKTIRSTVRIVQPHI